MDHQPLQLNSKAPELLFHSDKQRVFILPLSTLVFITLAPKVYRRRFIHVSLPLVVTKHHLAVQLQLRKSNKEGGLNSCQTHLCGDIVSESVLYL